MKNTQHHASPTTPLCRQVSSPDPVDPSSPDSGFIAHAIYEGTNSCRGRSYSSVSLHVRSNKRLYALVTLVVGLIGAFITAWEKK